MDNRTIDEIRKNETSLINELRRKENIINKAKKFIYKNTYLTHWVTHWRDIERDNEIININDDITEDAFISKLLEILDRKE